MHLPINMSNETARAFIGVRQPPWMTSTAPAASNLRRHASATESRPQDSSAAAKPASPRQRPRPVQSSTRLPSTIEHASAPSVLPSPAPSGESSPDMSTPKLAQGVGRPAQPDAVSSVSRPQTSSQAFCNVFSVQPFEAAAFSAEAAGYTQQASHALCQSSNPRQPQLSIHTDSYSLATPPAYRQPGQHAASMGANKRTSASAASARADGASPTGDHGPAAFARPAKRRRGDDSPLAFSGPHDSPDESSILQKWLQVIRDRVQVFGGFPSLDPSREKPRYKLLCDACTSGDVVYVILHQIFCMWSINRESVYSWLAIERAVVDSAFGLLLQALRRNSDLPPLHLQWFGLFPLGFQDVASLISHRLLHYAQSQISLFLQHFVTAWGPVIASIDARRFPLLSWELQSVLMCASPVLQCVLFTSSRRRLGIEDAAAHELYRLFTMDRRNESGQSNDPGETARVRAAIVARYRALVAQISCFGPTRAPSLPQTFVTSSPSDGRLPYPIAQAQSMACLPTMSTSPSSNAVAPQAYNHYGGHGGAYDPRMPMVNHAGAQAAGFANLQGETAAMMTAAPPHPTPNHVFAGGQRPVAIHPQGGPVAAPAPVQQRPTTVDLAMQGRWSYAPSTAPANLQARAPQFPAPSFPQHQTLQGPATGPLVSSAIGPVQPAKHLAHSQHRTAPLRDHELPQSDLQCIQNGLHLWALRSPKRAPARPSPEPFYQFLARFAAEPTAFPPRKGLRKLGFSLSEAEVSKIVRTSRTSHASRALYSNGSLRYCLRLCKRDRAEQQMSATHWAICPTFWPQHIFIACNGQPVRPRRRQHFQRDSAIELSDLVRPGENTVEISLPEVATNMDSGSSYFMGVEVITTLNYRAVRDLVQANEHIEAAETRREIQRRLASSDSDDIIAQDDHIRMAVTDPFSSILFKTPVRGADCKHMECFDLDIWLQTRLCKPWPQGCEPSAVDSWKCPICALDARPVSLRIDDFFAEVQRKLIQSDGVDIKQITIKSDGSWARIKEIDEAEAPDTEVRSPPDEKTRVSSANSATQAIVILDGD